MTQVVLTATYFGFLLIIWLAGRMWLRLFSSLFSQCPRDDQPGNAEAFLVGTAMLGLASYLVIAIFGRMPPLGYCLLVAVHCAMALVGWCVARRPAGPQWKRGLKTAFFIWAVILGLYAAQLPLTGYDARAIYGLKAKIVADGANLWGPDFRDPYRLHFGSNYPLLIPILESFLFRFRMILSGGDPWGDVGLPLIFYGFIVAGTLLVTKVTERLAPGWGIFSGVIWAITPMVWRWTEGAGLSGSADLPFAVFLAAGVFHLVEGWSSQDRFSLLLAGIFFGATILIKQEGLIGLGLGTVTIFVDQILWQRSRQKDNTPMVPNRGPSKLASFGVFLVILIPFLLFHRLVHAEMPQQIYMRSYAAALSWEWLQQITDRPATILSFAMKELINNHWGLAWPALVVALLLKRDRPLSPTVRRIRLFVLLLMAAYTGIFAVTPFPLLYHLHTAYARLMLHALPLAIVVLVEQLAASLDFTHFGHGNTPESTR